MSGQKPREIAVQVLQRRAERAEFVEDILEKALAKSEVSSLDRRFCQELVYGVVRWQAALDGLIAAKTSGRTQKTFLQNLLRLGLYQIFWLDRVPNHAAVYETVELAKQKGFGPQAGFVNAVLRGYLREFDATQARLTNLKITQPAVGYSHPQWLVNRWTQVWGAARAVQLMEWNNTPPRTYARVNTLRAEAGTLLSRWREENVEYDFVRRDWFEENTVFELKTHPPLARLPSFQQGWFYVQDPSTLLAVRELDPRPGERILDYCAAPGGKTGYLAQQLSNQGSIVAQDVTPDRVRLLEENCARLGVANVEFRLAQQPAARERKPDFDRILIDAPCSNTGVMRRRVDLRWRIRPEEIERLRVSQGQILRDAAALLKPEGILVYSTCSLEPEENAEVVDQFLREHPHFRLLRQRKLLPFEDEVDGAFVASMRRGG